MRGVWLVLSCWLAAQAMAGPRVVSLAPHTTELVIAAGGADLLVGAVPADRPLPRRVAPLHSYGGIDRERLLALRPDLIVIWTSGTHPADLAWLRSLDVRLYASASTRNNATLPQQLEHPRHVVFHAVLAGIAAQLGIDRWFVGRGNAGEIGDLAGTRAPVQALGVA